MEAKYKMKQLILLLVMTPITAVFIGIVPIYKNIKGKLTFKFNLWQTSFMVLFFWSLFVSIINKSWWSFLGSFSFLAYFLGTQFSNEIVSKIDNIPKILKTIINVTTLTAIIGIIEKVVFVLIDNSKHRIYSTYGNPNIAAGWFVLNIIMILYLFKIKSFSYNEKSLKDDKIKYIIQLLIILLALFFTGSRGGLISLVITIIIMSLFGKTSFKKRLLFFLTLILICCLSYTIFKNIPFISKYIVAHPFEVSFYPRVNIWKDGLDMIKEKPITGWGVLATFEKGNELMVRYGRWTIHLHNIWLAMFGSLGIVGFLIYILMKISLYKNIIMLFKTNYELAALSLSINIAIFIHGLVDMPIYYPQIGMIFAITGQIVTELTVNQKNSAKVPKAIGKVKIQRDNSLLNGHIYK